MKTTTFETAKVGDRVWCMRTGWGEIREISWTANYPIYVCFPSGEFATYTSGGLHDECDVSQTLFWDEVVIEAPAKPMPVLQVDAKVYAWNGGNEKYKRHFSHYGFNGSIFCFNGGRTSWHGDESLEEWDHWELAE